jgi:anti-sigma factor RsiW
VAKQKPAPEDEDLPENGTDELVAYLDGELDAKAAEAMATKLSLDAKLRAKADAYQRTWDILDVLPRPGPSSSFTTRTLSQAVPLLSGQQIVPQTALAVPTMPGFPASRSNSGFWLASLALVLAAAVAGYVAHRVLAPAPRTVAADPSLEDVPLMKNMRLYRDVDDMDYLKRLDTPEMFGDEGE